MTPSATFSIFHRPSPPKAPELQPPPSPDVRPVVAQSGPAPAWSADLAGVALAADQLGLANPGVITLRVTLPDATPTTLGSDGTGIYRPGPQQTPGWASFARDGSVDRRTGLAKGTHILTARGEIQVEALQPGDAALAMRGPALLPIVWIGRVTPAEAGARMAVRIAAGALGNQVPRRPLSVAPDHPVFIDPVPVPARTLVNGSTIQAVDMDDADLFQIDVGSPEVLFAEGVLLSSDQRVAP